MASQRSDNESWQDRLCDAIRDILRSRRKDWTKEDVCQELLASRLVPDEIYHSATMRLLKGVVGDILQHRKLSPELRIEGEVDLPREFGCYVITTRTANGRGEKTVHCWREWYDMQPDEMEKALKLMYKQYVAMGRSVKLHQKLCDRILAERGQSKINWPAIVNGDTAHV